MRFQTFKKTNTTKENKERGKYDFTLTLVGKNEFIIFRLLIYGMVQFKSVIVIMIDG